jgi:hypothetical protein
VALVAHGVPFDVALAMDDVWAQALNIIFGEMHGDRFDLARWAWKKP